MAGHAAQMVAKRNAHMILVGKPEGKRLGRPRCRWVNNIKMDRIGGMDCTDLADNRDQL
jgi:hypothetical protein